MTAKVQFKCQQCDRLLETDATLAGKACSCPFCHASMTAPSLPTTPHSSSRPSLRVCGGCGKELLFEARFCHACGRAINEGTSTASSDTSSESRPNMTNPLAFAINLYLNIERTDKKGFLGTRIFFGNTAPFAVRVEVTDTVTHQLVVSDVICQGVLALGTSSINTPEYQLGYDNDLPIAQSIMEWLSRHAAWGRAIKELMVHFSAYTSTNSYGLRNTRLDCDVLVGDYTDPGEKKKELFSTVIY